ncbi:MAG: leucyl/phenylalanyl-tRNA--protein transferase [Gammaproteobacteria bacterium]|nr:leucyl/phenylalanyl-tRNA--protein transferase [Gammaproteobacteria bacterium]
MPVRILSPDHPAFPPPEAADEHGLLAVGGDLSSQRLERAYRQGIFPWYSEGQPLLWWCPDPRAVLYPPELRVSRSLRRTLRSQRFLVRADRAFRETMLACAAPRVVDGVAQPGTWITDAMVDAYCELHRQGLAHSVECWQNDELVGGLYGVALGGAFFGESMFSRASDASKVALVKLVEHLLRHGFTLVDCQMPSAHLHRLGAREIPRDTFLRQLAAALALPGQPGPWKLDNL